MSEIYYSLHHLKKLIDIRYYESCNRYRHACLTDDLFLQAYTDQKVLEQICLLMLLALNNIVYLIPDLPFKSYCDNLKRKSGKMQTHMNHIPITTFHSM